MHLPTVKLHRLTLPARAYCDRTHELGFCFVRVNGTDYFPFIWLAKALGIPWYVFADGETAPLKDLEAALKKAGEAASASYANVVVNLFQICNLLKIRR